MLKAPIFCISLASNVAKAQTQEVRPLGFDRKAVAHIVEAARIYAQEVEKAILPKLFDTRVLAKELKMPEAMWQWVRENTQWVPYRGLLRRANGVLEDRSGESRASANDGAVKTQLDRASWGHSKIAATNFVELANSSLKLTQSFPTRRRCVDPQGLDNLKRIVQDTGKPLDTWPSFPQQAQPITAGDAQALGCRAKNFARSPNPQRSNPEGLR